MNTNGTELRLSVSNEGLGVQKNLGTNLVSNSSFFLLGHYFQDIDKFCRSYFIIVVVQWSF